MMTAFIHRRINAATAPRNGLTAPTPLPACKPGRLHQAYRRYGPLTAADGLYSRLS